MQQWSLGSCLPKIVLGTKPAIVFMKSVWPLKALAQTHPSASAECQNRFSKISPSSVNDFDNFWCTIKNSASSLFCTKNYWNPFTELGEISEKPFWRFLKTSKPNDMIWQYSFYCVGTQRVKVLGQAHGYKAGPTNPNSSETALKSICSQMYLIRKRQEWWKHEEKWIDHLQTSIQSWILGAAWQKNLRFST